MTTRASFTALTLAGLIVTGVAAGSGYAVAESAITSAQIKNHSIKGVDIKNNSLTGKQVKESTLSVTGSSVTDGTLTSADLAAGVVPRTASVTEGQIFTPSTVPSTALTAGGIVFKRACDLANNRVVVNVELASGGTDVVAVGIVGHQNASITNAEPAFGSSFSMQVVAPNSNSNAQVVFDGTMQPAGGTLQRVTIVGLIQRLPTDSYCSLRISATPIP